MAHGGRPTLTPRRGAHLYALRSALPPYKARTHRAGLSLFELQHERHVRDAHGARRTEDFVQQVRRFRVPRTLRVREITDGCRCGLRYRKQLETQAHVKKRMSIATLCTDGPEAAPKSASAATSPRLHWDVEEATADAAKSSSAQEAAKPAIAGRVSPLGMS